MYALKGAEPGGDFRHSVTATPSGTTMKAKRGSTSANTTATTINIPYPAMVNGYVQYDIAKEVTWMNGLEVTDGTGQLF